KPKREETYQVTLDALKLSPCYPTFLITAEVPEIFPKLHNQEFVKPPLEEEFVTFIQELGYSGKCDMLSAIHTNQMHQPWRTFAAIINRCISRKTTGLDRLREPQAQILWGMYNKKNVNYVALLWEDFMYQAENREINSARKEHMPYPRFTKVIISHFISKDNTISMRNKINLYTIRDDSLLGTLKFVFKTQDYQQYEALISDDMINQDIKDSKAYKTYDFATGKVPPKKARKYKKVASPSRKLSPVLEEEPAEKPKKTKKPAKKSTTVPTIGVVVRDTPGVPVSKKKAPAKGDKVGSQPKVDSGDDGSNDDDSDDVTKNDDEDDNDDEEEEHEEEYIRTPDSFEFNDDDEEYDELYKDVNVRSKVAEHKEVGKGDAEMTDTTHESASQEKSYKQVIEDAHVTLTSSQKTEGSKQSSSISSDFESNFLNLDNVSPAIDEVASMMNVKTPHEESSTPKSLSTCDGYPGNFYCSYFASLFGFNQRVTRNGFATQTALQSYAIEFKKKAQAEKEKYIDIIEKSVKEIIKDEVKIQLPQILPKEISNFATHVIQSTINESLENVVLDKSSSQPQSTYEAAASLTKFELKKILLDNLEKSKSYRAAEQHRDLYDALIKSYQLNKDLFDSYGKTYSLKRCREDKDKDEDPPAGSDQGLTKGRKSKSMQAEEPVFETADTKMPQDQGDNLGNTKDQPKIAKAGKPPTTFDELMSTLIDFSAYVLHNLKIENLTQEHLVGPAFNLLKGTCKSRVELEFHFEECYKAATNKLDWTNPEGHEYPFDLSKPLLLIEDQGGSLSSKYTTSTTKTKATKYDTIEGIKYMVPSLWSPVKSKHDVFSTKRIIAVTHVKVVKKYDYGYLDEIIVRREYHQLYKFVEGDFPRLNLRDIEDMLLLLVQTKLSNLERNDIFDLNVALWMFTRRVVILKRVEDLQLGVKSYQKKLNITRPETFRSNITKMTPYTAYNNPQGIIYQDKFKRNRLMRSDELYKFCDDTLTSFRRVLHDIASSLEMNYLPKRRWSKLDRKRSRIMIKAID
ncbi:hypothetical protein Tco_0500124, partial [Tanacetum coccineum]